YRTLNAIRRNGRELRLIRAFTPFASASAVLRGSAARCGKTAKTDGCAMSGLIVQGISASFWRWSVNCSVPLTVVCFGILYKPIALTTFMWLLGGSAIRPRAGPLPLL